MSTDPRTLQELLDEVYTPEGQAVWLAAPNPFLDGQVPAYLIASGEEERVMDVLAMLADGTFA